MIAFLPAITTIDYEKSNFDKIQTILDKWQ